VQHQSTGRSRQQAASSHRVQSCRGLPAKSAAASPTASQRLSLCQSRCMRHHQQTKQVNKSSNTKHCSNITITMTTYLFYYPSWYKPHGESLAITTMVKTYWWLQEALNAINSFANIFMTYGSCMPVPTAIDDSHLPAIPIPLTK